MTQKFTSLIEFLERFKDDDDCREYLVQMRWRGVPECPHCKSKKVYEYQSRPIYKCRDCNKQFRVTTGTIFESSNLPLRKWFLAMYLLSSNKKGISSMQLARELKITQKSAWYLAHKIREMLNNKAALKKLRGVVEVDETYVGGKRRGSKRGRGAEHKTPVFGMLERNGTLRIMPVEKVNGKTLKGLISGNVVRGTTIMSYEFKAYNGLSKFYIHKVVQHGIKEYVNGDAHVNSLEGAWSLLKRSIRGIYHRPSRKYLDNYWGEFEFRYNTRKKCIEMRFTELMKCSKIRLKHIDIRRTG
ncbi:IS1595 family transposase [Chitinophaga sp. CB10]|uniref:IS1595 family transposase n=1 Tax=Chitinophaga sp. CB10 TaxID=1891659 RepID=UPI0025C70C54|nr:IS1595 family transposase [Chitinophaga sp. CB10]